MTSLSPRAADASASRPADAPRSPVSVSPIPGVRPVNASNRFGWDYQREAASFGPPTAPIIDIHSHVNGRRAAAVLLRACDLYGVQTVYSMSMFEQADAVREVFGDRIRFIAVPDYWAKENRRHALAEGYARRIEEWHAKGARIAKLWAAPRSIDTARELGDPALFRLDAPSRIAAVETAVGLGMSIMVHVADPDTWFATRYADASIYGSKESHYEPFERLLDRFRSTTFIAAHMAGTPENLSFLSALLDRHPNLVIDTSACKWQVREWSKHRQEEMLGFLLRYRTRVLYGSDIVTTDEHLTSEGDKSNEMQRKAGSEQEAFDLYASRYWCYRAMLETGYEGESPVADPDLAMVEPDRYDDMSAPRLVGRALPPDLLRQIYHDNARRLFG